MLVLEPGDLQEWISSAYSNISLKCKFFTRPCVWLCTRHDLRSYEVITAFLPLMRLYNVLTLFYRHIIAQHKCITCDKSFRYWQLRLVDGFSFLGGGAEPQSWASCAAAADQFSYLPKVQMKSLKLRLCKAVWEKCQVSQPHEWLCGFTGAAPGGGGGGTCTLGSHSRKGNKN